MLQVYNFNNFLSLAYINKYSIINLSPITECQFCRNECTCYNIKNVTYNKLYNYNVCEKILQDVIIFSNYYLLVREVLIKNTNYDIYKLILLIINIKNNKASCLKMIYN